MKVFCATALLLAGVCLVASTAETKNPWWAFGGYLCLIFVPALVVDSVRGKR